MRCEIPQPCMGSRSRIFRISRSSVPCSKSLFGFGIVEALLQTIYKNDTIPFVDCQEESHQQQEMADRGWCRPSARLYAMPPRKRYAAGEPAMRMVTPTSVNIRRAAGNPFS